MSEYHSERQGIRGSICSRVNPNFFRFILSPSESIFLSESVFADFFVMSKIKMHIGGAKGGFRYGDIEEFKVFRDQHEKRFPWMVRLYAMTKRRQALRYSKSDQVKKSEGFLYE